MKRILLALFLLAAPTMAWAQCNGVFPNSTVCGNATGAPNLPRPTSPSAFQGSAGGTNGQIQYNNAGALGGRNTSGNGTVVGTTSGTLTNGHCVKIDSTGNLIDSGAICGGGSAIYVLPSDFGFACDGTTDVSTAFQSMVTASTSKTIFIPPGPACVLGTPITLPSNTTITGGGWDSIVKSTSTSAAAIFTTTDTSNVSLTNFAIQGTNAISNWASASFGAFTYILDGSAVAAQSNITFSGMKVSSFNATYWTGIQLSGATVLLTNVNYTNNLLISDASSPPTSPANGETNYGFVFYSGTVSQLRYAKFSGNEIQGAGLCFGFIFYGGLQYVNMDQNNIQSIGQTVPTHCNNADGSSINAYGISVYDLYDNGNYGSLFTINGNIISLPYASGVYIVGGSAGVNTTDATIANNLINSQTSADNISLPRAAIAINAAGDITINGNNLESNFGGIDIVAVKAGEINIVGNRCYTGNGTANSHCLRFVPGVGTSNTEVINASANIIYVNNAAGQGINLAGSVTGARFNQVSIVGNHVKSVTSSTGLLAGGQFFSGQLTVSGNTFTGAGTAANLGSITGNLALASNLGLSFTAATLPATVNGSNVFVSDGAPASACTGTSTGSMGFRQNGAWKCF